MKDIAGQRLSTGAHKDDAGKVRFDLIPPEAIQALAEVFTLGAAKYADRNWEKGIPFSKALASMKRHLSKFELGELYNEEDGGETLHLTHVMWWATVLVTFIERCREDLDDLPHAEKRYPIEGGAGIQEILEARGFNIRESNSEPEYGSDA